ncbi:MAG TPA: RNA methyltransferase, partial [Candidatus Omnitrophota bacterium]|nr:RNA methyltransferase [Candidatus Omnitrophota bacterium]
MRKLTHQQIVSRQEVKRQEPKLPFCVVLNNIRSAHNVGSIFRTCDGVGVEKVWLCGITGYPPNAQIAKTALGSERHVPWEYQEHIEGVIQNLKKKGYQIVLLEQTEKSLLHYDFKPKRKICLIVGNEITGVCDSILQLSDAAIEIEMAGIKNSLNVSVAFGVAAY